jgi:hypothetical protein
MTTEVAPYGINEVIMAVGNDFMHFDSVRNKTSEGEHTLDVDTRYARVYLAALKCLVYMVERALDFSPVVKPLYIPGNHDLSASFGLLTALAQRFMNDSRVKFDLRGSTRKAVRYGSVLLAYDHGSYAKAERLALSLLTENVDWLGGTTWREIHVGHRHQSSETMFRGVTPTNGVYIRQNPSQCNADVWHARQGFTDPLKTVEAWRYDQRAYRGSHVATADDSPNPNLEKARVVPGGPNWKERLPL